MPLILATDVDGTITDKNRRLSLKAARLLRKLQEMKVVVILVSSHAFPAVSTLADYLGINYIIAETGVCGGSPWKPLFVRRIKNREVVLESLIKHNFTPTESNSFRLGDIAVYPPKNMTIDDALILLDKIVKEFDLDYTYSGFAIHIFPRGVNKGWGLRTLLECIKTNGPIIVLGDGENDIPLFEKADLAITSIESPKKLRDAADIIMPFNSIDTTLYTLEIIERFIKLRKIPDLDLLKQVLTSE
ncbi:MAG: HAD hydrolase family protein [Crenarchaeota archaeon]|nr:HAD hydrolase family protein [Thermoproteota archaeon]MCR8455411.1 HAD hydrolase family protein [Thermoproteota archaeon]MCR8501074.1 HAD hydrolase family protein [Thermoproteota archaeon]